MSTNFFDLSRYSFSRRKDVVNPGKTIYNPLYSNVRTMKGKDQIIGNSSIDYSLEASVEVAAAAIEQGINPANSVEFITQSNLNVDGIINRGNIYTGRGGDTVYGSGTAQITAVAQTVSQAIAIADTADAAAIANSLAAIEVAAVVNGINNSGKISTGPGSDSVVGEVNAAVGAIATASVDAIAIVTAIAEAPMSEGLKAVAQGFAISLAQAKVVATGINNKYGEISTGLGSDNISATATSYSATYAAAEFSAISAAAPSENKALAQAVMQAIAETEDKAIAINNKYGDISTGFGADTIEANASGSKSYGIYGGDIRTGFGADTIKAYASGSESYGIYGSDIRTGFGADTIKANASGSESYGIYGGDIRTGFGADTIEASSFGGGVNINMGHGEDYVEGFGDAIIYGDSGFDTLSLGSYNKGDFDIHVNGNFTVFELDGISMKTSEFEKYTFADGDYSSHNLIA